MPVLILFQEDRFILCYCSIRLSQTTLDFHLISNVCHGHKFEFLREGDEALEVHCLSDNVHGSYI